MQQHRIDIEEVGIGAAGARYRVHHAGEVLIPACRVPLLDASRALLARGLSGRVVMYSKDSDEPRLAINIQEGALLSIAEGIATGPRFARWTPHPRTDFDAISESAT